MDRMLQLQRILFHYDLNPLFYEIKGSIIKIETAMGLFVLKRKKFTADQAAHLQTAYRLARKLLVDALCPLPSKYGDLLIGSGDNNYYLMPWLDETVPQTDLLTRYGLLFLKAAQMHHQTIDGEEDARPVSRQMIQLLTGRQGIWESFVAAAEHHIYPSPFEQLVLFSAGHYLSNLQRALAFFQQGLSENEKEKDKKEDSKNPRTLRRALCHGRLNPLHLLIENEKSCLISFESCTYGPFIIEAASLFEQAAGTLFRDRLPWLSWVRNYLDACPLTENETAFLFHFLICPRLPVTLLEKYSQDHAEDELYFTRRWTKALKAQEEMLSAFQDYFEKKESVKTAGEKESEQKESEQKEKK